MVLDPKLEFLGFVCIVLALANVLQIIFLYGLEQAELKSVQNGNNNSINKVFAEKKNIDIVIEISTFFFDWKKVYSFFQLQRSVDHLQVQSYQVFTISLCETSKASYLSLSIFAFDKKLSLKYFFVLKNLWSM